jgi:flagellar biosynthesis protein FliP
MYQLHTIKKLRPHTVVIMTSSIKFIIVMAMIVRKTSVQVRRASVGPPKDV